METPVTVGGRYALEGQLGAGGMGHVYRVRHLQLGKTFALKIIAPAFAGDAVARARFDEEARLASSIAHPNVVSVVDFGEDPALGAYMVMELVEGEPLFPAGAPPMSVRRTLDVMAQITDALDHIHKLGIVHGDIKAENILLVAENSGPRRRQVVRLLDFGLARRSGGDGDGLVTGSPHYLAPERARGGAPSPSADVYALGVLMYLLLTGRVPFDGTVVQILTGHLCDEPAPLSSLLPEALDERLEAFVLRAMAKDPAERHANVAALRYELNTVMDMLGIGRRRSAAIAAVPAENPRQRAVVAAFERSRLPQALLSADGVIAVANRAFRALLGRADDVEGATVAGTPLADAVPGLLADVRAVAAGAAPHETRVVVDREHQPSLALVLWLAPTGEAGREVQLVALAQEL